MLKIEAWRAAYRDLARGVELAPLWWRLGVEQLITRYRRTILGPFWIASSTLATAIALSVVFGSLFGGAWRENFPFVLAGVVAWSLAGSIVSDGANTFITASGTMQVHKLPLTFHSFLQMTRVMLTFFHQLIAFWIVTLVLKMGAIPHWEILFSIPVVLMVGLFASIPLGMLSTRFRDINYMINFIMSALFMLTPVFWRRSQIRDKLHWIVDYNPMSHLIEIVRQPLLGHPAPLSNWMAVAGIFASSAIIAFLCLVLFRRRVVFWL
jgi:ABC-type polysaccharide/polyol phosphate export permease